MNDIEKTTTLRRLFDKVFNIKFWIKRIFGKYLSKKSFFKNEQYPGGIVLDNLLNNLPVVNSLHKGDLQFSDRVVIKTQNSDYDLLVVGSGDYMISGGWFDKNKLSPHRISINGCTWGGNMLWKDAVAAPGMCIEFENQVLTSPVKQVSVIRAGEQNSSIY